MILRKDLKTIWAQVPPDYYEEGIANNFLQKLWHNRKWASLKKIVNESYDNILDVGCASGWLTARLAELFPEGKITGMDVSLEMIDYAKRVHPKIKFICTDAHKLPFAEDSFDLIICTEVLEHVVDPLNVLLEIKRCLSPRGEAIISMDTGSLLFKIIWMFWTRSKGKVWKDAHLHEFNRDKLVSLIKKAGFEIKQELVSHLGMAVTLKITRPSL
jgi:2-polyprenyl-3-methyl-5-hydroxy-6-metoxy-1,4-benzoquinol methylase